MTINNNQNLNAGNTSQVRDVSALSRTIKDLQYKLKSLKLAQKSSLGKSKEKTGSQNNWFPKLGDSNFEKTYLFVLLSIYSTPTINANVYSKCLDQTVQHFLNLTKSHGITDGTRRFKEKAQYVVLLAENRNPPPLPWVATIKGPCPVPKHLDALLPLVLHISKRDQNWIACYQALITILAMPRLSKEIPDLDIESITSARTSGDNIYQPFISSFREFVKTKFLKKMGGVVDTARRPFLYIPRLRMTKGPNGEATLASAVREAKALIEDKVLGKSLELFLAHTGGKDLYHYIRNLAESSEVHEDTRLGRLSQVPDSLNKNRVVAMVDYWTNLILAPLEEAIRDILKRNFHDNDYLRNHNLGSEKVREFQGKSWSLDLSSWTDRFPLDLQQIIVEALLGKNCGQHWATLLVGRDYWCSGLGRGLRYKVGQPMGAKSSFAVASLTHHALIHYCHSLVEGEQLPIAKAYMLVGDDLILFDHKLMLKVREAYEALGVKIQDLKSKIPVADDSFTEFCSRVSINNVEASRVPPSLVKNASCNWRDIPNLLIEMRKRGIEPNIQFLTEIPYLSRVSRSGQLYLHMLAEVMVYPIMGHNLSDYAVKIWPEVPKQKDSVRYGTVVAQVLRGVEKVNEAIDVVQTEFKLGHEDYEVVESFEFSDDQNFDIWGSEGALYRIASRSELQPKGWESELPHPASIAALWLTSTSWRDSMRGFPSLEVPEGIDDNLVVDTSLMKWLHNLGRRVGSVLPKTAEQLIPTAGNFGTEYQRDQISTYSRLIQAAKKKRQKATFTNWKITVDLSMYDPESPFLSFIEWGSMSDDLKRLVVDMFQETQQNLAERQVMSAPQEHWSSYFQRSRAYEVDVDQGSAQIPFFTGRQ